MNRELSPFWQDIPYALRVGLRSTVAKNAASLYIIQFVNYIVPLIMVPYLFLLVLYGIVLGNVLFPTRPFQGMERMVAISVINLGMKIAVLALSWRDIGEQRGWLHRS